MTQTNHLLGYPDDARLLIINADDFGMCHAINTGIIDSLQNGVVQSTSLMTPCPWALHAMTLLRQNPAIAFGVHLTVIAEQPLYRWGPLTSREKVPTLLDEAGYFYTQERIPEFIERASLIELETEFRAQIETVLNFGLQPTHLDWHCLRNGGSKANFDLTMRLAQEYGLAVRVYDPEYTPALQAQGLPCNDFPLLDSYDIPVDAGKSAHYAQLLRDLPAGLSEWAVHPGLDTPEMRAVEPDINVRPTDHAFVLSPDAQRIIAEEGIILLSYREIQKVWVETTNR